MATATMNKGIWSSVRACRQWSSRPRAGTRSKSNLYGLGLAADRLGDCRDNVNTRERGQIVSYSHRGFGPARAETATVTTYLTHLALPLPQRGCVSKPRVAVSATLG